MTDRFWSKVEKTEACWLWIGYVDREGYGRLNISGTPQLAHRLAYAELVGPIPAGLTIDHLCRVRNCVNPEHLEPVTRGENLRRGEAPNMAARRANVCKRGHSLEGAYVRKNGTRMCRECQRVRRADRHLIGPDVRRDDERGPHRITLRIEDVA